MELRSDCLMAIAFHSDSNITKIQRVIDSGITPHIVAILREP